MSNRPADIPESAWSAACDATDVPFPDDIERIARALMAERARCADIVAARLRRHSGDIEIAPILRQLEAAIRGDAP